MPPPPHLVEAFLVRVLGTDPNRCPHYNRTWEQCAASENYDEQDPPRRAGASGR
jgi:hypothetical protein